MQAKSSRARFAIFRYSLGILAPVIALLLRLELEPVIGPNIPYLPFVLAIIVVARVAGPAAGYVATLFSAVIVDWFFLSPTNSMVIAGSHAFAGLSIFFVTGLLIAKLVGGLNMALESIRRAQSALQHQSRLVDLSHDAIITMDASRVITAWNLGAEEIYGFTQNEALGRVLHELLKTSGVTAAAEVDRGLHLEGRWEGELTHIGKDGRHVCVESRHVLLRDEQQRAVGILEINRDITLRAQAERARDEAEASLRRERQFLEVIVAHAPYPLAVLRGRELRYTLANPAFQALIGPTAEIVGRSWREVFPEAAAQGAERHLLHTLETGEPWIIDHFESPLPGGVQRTWEGTAVRLPAAGGDEPSVLLNTWDVTGKVEREQAIREREAMLDAFFAASPVLLNLFDERLRFLDSDPVSPSYFGLDRRSIVGRSLTELGAPALAAMLREVLENGSPKTNLEFESPLPSRNGEAAVFRASIFPVPLPGGKRGAGAMAFEITEAKRAEKALQENAGRQAFFVRLDDALRPLADPVEIEFAAARVLGEHLGAQRAGYAESTDAGRTLIISRPFVDGVTAIEGRHRLADYGATLQSRMLAGQFVIHHDIAHDAAFTEAQKATYADMSVGSMANIPLVKEGRLVAVLFTHFSTAHVFTDGEISMMTAVGERTWAAVERARAEAALRESEERLSLAIEFTELGAFDYQPPSGRLIWSDVAKRHFGLGPDAQVDYSTFLRGLHPDDRDRVNHIVENALKIESGGRYGAEYRTIGIEDGCERWLSAWGRAVFDAEGQPTRLIGVTLDITDRKRLEEQLRQRAEEMGKVMDVAPVAIWVAEDPACLNITGNRMANEFYQAERGENVSANVTPVRRFFSNGRELRADELPMQVAATQGIDVRNAELDVLLPSGSWIHMLGHASPLRDPDGGVRGCVGTFLDITDRKASEDALRQSERRYRTLFESMQEGFAVGEIIADLDGKPVDWRYLDVNPAFEKMFGYGRNQLIGRTYRELFPEAPWQYWVPALGHVAATGKPARLEYYGSELGRYYEAIAYSPNPGQFAAVFGDVTDRKGAEERLRQTQKLESIGLLAGGVAHDFNNLLTVILGSASSALDECPTCEHSKAIVAAAERAAHLTQQLLAYAGKGQFIRKAINLTDLVSRARTLLSASVPKRVELVYELAPGLPPVDEDPSRLEQILMNLVINAGEAIPAKTDGRIEIRTGAGPVTAEAARLQPRYEVTPGDYVWLEVRDNGTGMDEATQSRVFDPFFSTKFTGRGLGLAAVDGIVRSASGFIEVRSVPGVGTTFRVLLPSCSKPQTPEKEPETRVRPTRTASSVLVVDDEEMVRKLARMILQRHGYEVLEATDGRHALQVMRDAPQLPAVVLLDLAMPVMGGDELVPILVREYPRIKIVVSSGYPENETRRGFGNAALVAAFLQKPYTSVGLAQKIDEVLGATPPPARLAQTP